MNLPKLALEVDALTSGPLYGSNLRHVSSSGLITLEPTTTTLADDTTADSPSSNSSTSRKMTLDQAKRLLALASIRPSKTFHKSMTDEEIEVLKKYYELMKPKGSMMSSSSAAAAAEAAERAKYQNSPPVVYNTSKLNSSTLINLRTLLEHYKKDLDSGEYMLEFDQSSEESTGRFVLKSTSRSMETGSPSKEETSTALNESPIMIRFPDELNDALVAFAISTGDRENRTLGEANLFRIINWNDASTFTSPAAARLNAAAADKSKKSKTSDEKQQQQQQSSSSSILPNILLTGNQQSTSSPLPNSSSSSSSSPNSSTLSFEYIRNLSSLINSILEPRIVKQLTYTGVDVGYVLLLISYEHLKLDKLN